MKVSIVSVSLFAALVATPALAANDGFHPGSFCVLAAAGTAAYVDNRIENRGSGQVTIECPLFVRDASATGKVRVQALDRSLSGTVACSLGTMVSGSVSYVDLPGTSGHTGGWQVTTLTGATVGFGSTSNPRSNWVECLVPAPYLGQYSAVGAYYFIDN